MSDRLDRFELKFVVTRGQREALLAHLRPQMRADTNADDHGFYPIISLYYDNADRDCYWEKVRGVGSRRKLRARVYGSRDGQVAPTSFVEVKHKCDGRVVKRRVQMPVEDALAVCAGEAARRSLSLAERRVVEEVQRLAQVREFRPVCCMRYDRQALAAVDPASDLRITFDSGIGWRLDDLIPVPDDRQFSRYLLPDGAAVMEVKGTGAVPYELSRLLGATGCRLASFSKYCNALAAGDPSVQRTATPSSATAGREQGGPEPTNHETSPPCCDLPGTATAPYGYPV